MRWHSRKRWNWFTIFEEGKSLYGNLSLTKKFLIQPTIGFCLWKKWPSTVISKKIKLSQVELSQVESSWVKLSQAEPSQAKSTKLVQVTLLKTLSSHFQYAWTASSGTNKPNLSDKRKIGLKILTKNSLVKISKTVFPKIWPSIIIFWSYMAHVIDSHIFFNSYTIMVFRFYFQNV